MKLKNYAPAGNELLLELKEYRGGSIITIQPEHDKVMKVLKVGPTVTALNPLTGEKVKPGDFCIVVAPNLLTFSFDPEEPEGPKIETVQCKEFAISSYYLPDPDEKKYFPHIEFAPKEESRTMNVIDNTGVDKSTYLKEERDNQVLLNAELDLKTS